MKRLALIALAAVAAVTLAACDASVAPQSSAQKTKAAAETNQTNLLAATPIPVLQRSEERENLIKRAGRLNQQNMTGCVSVFTPNGVLLYQGVVDGKVSSLNSYLLPGDQLQTYASTYGAWGATIEAPDIDGAYGANADGVFFFNAESDAYIEAGNVTYIFTDQCLKTEQKPLLVQQVAAE
jgi:hypothetical protein